MSAEDNDKMIDGKKIVITGGCGFIGVNLIEHLMGRGKVSIRVIDNLVVGSRDDLLSISKFTEIGRGDLTENWMEGVSLVVGDILDGDLAKEVTRGADSVVHLAASTGVIPSIEDPKKDMESNVIGTVNYLEASRQNGVSRFVFASSGAPLGDVKPPINEKCVPRPLSPYGAGKLAGEGYCTAYFGSFDLATVVLRFGNVYGPRSTHKGSVVAKFIKNILEDKPLVVYGDGSQTRDFVYVGDLIEAIFRSLVARRDDAAGEIFQIATNRETTVNEIAEILSDLAKEGLSFRPEIIYEEERKGEIKRNYSDIAKARGILGFEPAYDIRGGLEETFGWFLDRNRK
jgi:UDP-glucose 4-epimerase